MAGGLCHPKAPRSVDFPARVTLSFRLGSRACGLHGALGQQKLSTELVYNGIW